MAGLSELAKSLKEKEEALTEDYKRLEKLGDSKVARKVIDSLLLHHKLQLLSLDLLTATLPEEFLDFGQITADDVNLRQGPGGSYPLVCNLTKGAAVIIQATQGFWVKVAVPHGPEGWVFSDYVRSETDKTSPAASFAN